MVLYVTGLKRTGESCRLRWLNYLRPDVRRGNITTEEQLLIIELHAKWGNRSIYKTYIFNIYQSQIFSYSKGACLLHALHKIKI
jgi:hypothetical protein